MVAEFVPNVAPLSSLPPQNIDAEEALLGSILLDPQAIGVVADRLRPEAFFISANAQIYQAALAIHAQGRKVDLISVTTWLYDRGQLEKVGGQYRLAEILKETVSSINADHYADLINDKYARRELIKAGNHIVQIGYEAFKPLSSALGEARERLEALMSSSVATGKDEDELAYEKLCKRIQDIELNIANPGLRLFKLQELAKTSNKSVKQLEAIYFMSLLAEENESLLSWKELCDRYGDQVREWLLHGFLPKGVTVAVHARGGVGKTRLVYDMVHTLLTGGMWNGFPTTGARRAIVIQTDESAGDMLDALRRRGFDESLENIRYKTRWTFEHIPQLRAEIEEFKPEVIVIDSITSVSRHSLFSENDVQYARPILKLKDLAQQYGCSIVLVHHSSKNGEARGTTAIFNSVSEVWKLERDAEDKSPSSTKRLLTIEKSRSRRPTAYRLDFEPENGSWSLLGEVGVDENNPELPTKERIVEFLLRNLNVRYESEEIAHEITASPPRVRICCAQLAGDGIISHISGNRKKPNLYFIAHETPGDDRSVDHPPTNAVKPFSVDRPPDQLNSSELVRVSESVDRPSAKNVSGEEEKNQIFADQLINSNKKSLEPNPSEDNSVDRSVDHSVDRVDRGGDQLNQKSSWTKNVFAAINSPEEHADVDGVQYCPEPPFGEGETFLWWDEKVRVKRIGRETLYCHLANGTPESNVSYIRVPIKEAEKIKAQNQPVQKHEQPAKGQWGRIKDLGSLTNKLVCVVETADKNGNMLVSEEESPEFSGGVAFFGTLKVRHFAPLTQIECLAQGLRWVKSPAVASEVDAT